MATERSAGDGWEIVCGHHLAKEYTFPDFRTALEFVNEVGALADEADHHPDVHLAWGRVRLEIWTHTIDGITEKDHLLAAQADEAYGH
jgi:4a-hydroxytetrahydrobiopterin dehydratase